MFQKITQIVIKKLVIQHYLAVKNLSSLWRQSWLWNSCDFLLFAYFNFFRAKNKLKLHKRICENKDVFNVITSSEDTEILEFNK